MMFLLSSAAQITVILLLALLSLPMLRKKSASTRHCVLSVAIVLAACVPMLNLVMPSWNHPAVITTQSAIAPLQHQIAAVVTRPSVATVPVDATGASTSTPESREQGSTLQPAAIWLGGVAAGVFFLLLGLVRLARVAAGSSPMTIGPWTEIAEQISRNYGLRRPVQLLQSQNSSILVTWGILRPKVILPAGAVEWSQERATVVLRHELAHVRRHDWVMQMIAQSLRVAFWFNPLVWVVCKRLRLESECACDDAVVGVDGSGIEGHEYAAHLLDLARVLNRTGSAWSAALSMARSSTIERRFSAMLDPHLNRRPATRIALCAAILAGLAATLALSIVSTAKEATVPAPVYKAASARPALEPIAVEAGVQPTLHPVTASPTVMAPAKSERAETSPPQAVPPTPPTPPPTSERFSIGNGPRQETFELLWTSRLQTLRDGIRNALTPVRPRDRALYEAAEEGDLSEIDALIRAGANVNVVVMGDGSPLMGAARSGRLEVVTALLDRGADPNVPVPGDGTALIVAAQRGQSDIVKTLLDRGADMNQPVLGDGNPLIAAASHGRADIVKLLLDRGANIEQVVPGDENALIQASANGHLDVVKLLVSRRADVNARVYWNARQGLSVAFQAERGAGAESFPNPSGGEWRSALSEARRRGHREVVEFLLSVGARD